jgi:hypothetical protein
VLQWTGPPTIQDLKALKTDFGKEMLEILTKINPNSFPFQIGFGCL